MRGRECGDERLFVECLQANGADRGYGGGAGYVTQKGDLAESLGSPSVAIGKPLWDISTVPSAIA